MSQKTKRNEIKQSRHQLIVQTTDLYKVRDWYCIINKSYWAHRT